MAAINGDSRPADACRPAGVNVFFLVSIRSYSTPNAALTRYARSHAAAVANGRADQKCLRSSAAVAASALISASTAGGTPSVTEGRSIQANVGVELKGVRWR
eukprot:31363-Pelagococcus_subviridis.AAC.11